MAANYSKYSPYYTTKTFGSFLDLLDFRPIPKNALDIEYTIGPVYKNRPDMLAFDLYGNSALWWVFSARNPDILKDPVFDFYPGKVIYIPSKETIMATLGI